MKLIVYGNGERKKMKRSKKKKKKNSGFNLVLVYENLIKSMSAAS